MYLLNIIYFTWENERTEAWRLLVTNLKFSFMSCIFWIVHLYRGNSKTLNIEDFSLRIIKPNFKFISPARYISSVGIRRSCKLKTPCHSLGCGKMLCIFWILHLFREKSKLLKTENFSLHLIQSNFIFVSFECYVISMEIWRGEVFLLQIWTLVQYYVSFNYNNFSVRTRKNRSLEISSSPHWIKFQIWIFWMLYLFHRDSKKL